MSGVLCRGDEFDDMIMNEGGGMHGSDRSVVWTVGWTSVLVTDEVGGTHGSTHSEKGGDWVGRLVLVLVSGLGVEM